MFYNLFRGLLWSVTSTYCSHTFGPMSAATIFGFASFLNAFLQLVQWPAFIAVNKYADGDFFPLNAALIGLTLPIFWWTNAMRAEIDATKEGID